MIRLEILAHRASFKYSRREKIERVLWGLASPFFRWSPRHCYSWRNALLRRFGARIGKDVQIYPSVRIFMPSQLEIGSEATIGPEVQLYNLGPMRLGAQVTVSQGAHLCGGSHDDSDPAFRLIRAPITLGDGCWICADAFVGPSVSIGAGAVLGARAVAMRDVPAWQVHAGNPARYIRDRRLAGAASQPQ